VKKIQFARRQLLLAQGDRTPVVYITAHEGKATTSEVLNNGSGFFVKADANGDEIIGTLRRVTSTP